MIPLYCYVAAVLVVVGLATLMECGGLRNGVSGANGFVWLMLCLFMGTCLFPLTALVWFFQDSSTAFLTFLLGGAWLGLWMWLTMKMMVATERQK